jgi:peptidase M1-like protein
MIRRFAVIFCLLGSVALEGQQPRPAVPVPTTPRAIRRDIPMTNAIRRAYEAGTRDATGRPGPNYWQLQTDYTISVRLDPAAQTLTGTETIGLHNNSPQALNEVMLRLDHNIFRPSNPHAAPWVPAESTDGMVVTRLAVNGEAVDLAPPPAGGFGGRGRGEANAPRRLTASALDQTVARINLATPIAAKSNATLEIAWHTKLPGGPNGRGHRMTQRFDDVLFQPTQWYPRVAKYDDLRGWDTSTYLGPSEFYNNFGRFDVRMDVPAGWIVSGTGVLQNPQEVLTAKARERLTHVLESDDVITIVGDDEVGPGKSTAPGDRLTWHFVADMVNDFAWATAKDYVWRATRATIPGKGPVPIHMLFQPSHANLYASAGPIARHALEFYSKLWAPYPFPQLTLQDGPSAGMEYPMVINSNQGAADHETGHQWWPMMVGNNETWYGWMDEGFNQYMNILSAADSRGVPPNLNGPGQSYGRISGNEDEPIMMYSANYGGPMYSFQTYSKTPLMLSMLGGIVGDAEVQRAMSEYTKAWAFKHPSPWDYITFMDKALGKDLGWFWYYWLWTTESVDGSIAGVTTSGAKTTVTVRQDGQMPSPVVLKVEFAASGPAIKPMANSKAADDRTAIVTWPVDVWFTGSRAFQAVLDFGGRSITKITLDPGCRFPDRDPTDNVWPRPAAPPATAADAALRAPSCGA